MNSLIILPDECRPDSTARVVGERAHYLWERHELHGPSEVRGGILGGNRGRIEVVKASPGEYELRLDCNDPPLPLTPTVLILAVPRPQTVRKIVQLAAMCGLAKLCFVRSSNVEKSYFASKALTPTELDASTIEGLEQSETTLPPEITVHQRFRPFLEDILPGMLQTARDSKGVGLIGSLDSNQSLADLSLSRIGPSAQVVLAIGPELGWSEYELASFKDQGLTPVSLGERSLRVEVATAMLLGQIELLRGSQRAG